MSRRVKKYIGKVALIAVCLLWSAPAFSGPLAGDSDVQVAGGLFHAQGSDTGNLNLDLTYGYYLTPGWQVGFRQALNYEFIDHARDVWTATTTPFLAYYFRVTDTFLPYLGGFIGLVWNDRDVTGTIGPQAGAKFFFHPQTYVALQYRYEWFFNSLERVGRRADHGNHVLNIGLGYVWGGSGPRK